MRHPPCRSGVNFYQGAAMADFSLSTKGARIVSRSSFFIVILQTPLRRTASSRKYPHRTINLQAMAYCEPFPSSVAYFPIRASPTQVPTVKCLHPSQNGIADNPIHHIRRCAYAEYDTHSDEGTNCRFAKVLSSYPFSSNQPSVFSSY